MDCAAVASVLVAYHFATASDEERAGVDEHLVACRPCLETYLALKRAADARARAHEDERPSSDARARLRADVARTFGARAPRPPFFARRIPLYQGVVAAAVAAALALAVPRLFTPKPEVGAGTPLLDTSRAAAQSLSIY